MKEKFEYFWEHFADYDFDKNYTDLCEILSEPLSDDILSEYDVMEVVLDIWGHLESKKDFDKLINLANLLRNNQKELYDENFAYFNTWLIEYYIFLDDLDAVKEYFKYFIEEPDNDIDLYIHLFKILSYYNRRGILEEATEKSYQKIKKSSKVITGGESFLDDFELFNTWQYIYEDILQQKKVPDDEIIKKVRSIKGIKWKDKEIKDFISCLHDGNSELETLKLLNDRNTFFQNFTFCLTKYLYTKKIPFYNFYITTNLATFFHNNKKAKTVDELFKLEFESFKNFVYNFSSWFFDNTIDMVVVLWGSVYVYDFLLKNGIIQEETYKEALDVIRNLKAKMIFDHISELWRYNFVHNWEKPDGISEQEFIEEDKIFRKSFDFKTDNFRKVKKDIKEELKNMGELGDYILKYKPPKEEIPILDLLKNDYSFEPGPPIVKEKKVGRNDPCPCGSGKKYKHCCGRNK